MAALLAVVGAIAVLTLSASAQTPGGESGSTETAEGRIIARVQDRTGEDGVDDYRIEFGFFPEWALDEAESWPEAIGSRSDWLPSSRFLTKSRIDARATADNRGWLRSSLITVPAQSAQSPGGAGAEITGRVIARYNPDSEGRLRVEFGFVPTWAFTDTSSTAEAVERLGADGLPRARYLRVATIDARRDVWLRSSVINVPLHAPVVVIEQPQAPVIDSVSCAPSSPTVDEDVTCTATLSGGAPDSYAWSGGASNGSGATYTTSFGTAGEATVSLTVTNVAGSDTESVTLTVAAASTGDGDESTVEDLQPPVIDGIDCAPASPAVDEDVTCTAILSGEAPDSYSWSGGGDNGDGDSYTTSFGKAGEYTVSLMVTNSAGSDSDSVTLTVVAASTGEDLQPPVIDSITCSPESPTTEDEFIECTANLSGGAPDSWAWNSGGNKSTSDRYSLYVDTAGEYTISLTVTNSSGSDSGSFTFTVTVSPPVISHISCSPTSPTVSESVTCGANISRGGRSGFLSFAWSGGGSNGSDERYTTSFATAGEHTVSLTATNSSGSGTNSITLTVTEPVQSPVIDGVSCTPSSPEVDEDVTCTANLSGGAPDSWAWRGGASSGNSAAYNTSFDSAGAKTVSLTVTNSAGSDSDSVALTVAAASTGEDLQPPVIDSISCSPESPTAGESMTCTAALSGGAPDSWAWRGGGASSDSDRGSGESFTPRFDIQGRFMVALTVTNAAGSDSDSVTLTVAAASTGDGGESTGEDLQAPVIDSISCSPLSPPVGQSVSCTANLSGGAPDSYSWSGGALGGNSAEYNTSFGSAGSKTVSLTVTNSAGSDTNSTTLTVAEPGPVIYSITCSPSSPTVGESVTCTAELGGGDPDTYAWSVGGGSGSGESYTASFDTAGGYTVSLTVTNSGGRDTESTRLTIAARSSAPVIDSISCDGSYLQFLPVCTATLSGGTPTSREWSGGGPNSELGYRNIIYRPRFYGAGTSLVVPGEYTISLTVRNASGSDTESITLTVAKPAPYVNSVRCAPASPLVGESVTCTALISRGAPESYSWSGGASSGSAATYTTSFATAGEHTVTLTATNSSGSDTNSSLPLTVVKLLQAPVIDGITCSPPSPTVGDSVTCTAELGGDDPETYAWSGGASSGASGSGDRYETSFTTAGEHTVSLTATNSGGSDTESTTLTVASHPPVIDSISCDGSYLQFLPVCTATLSGGAPTSREWSGGGPNSELGYRNIIYRPRFYGAGTSLVVPGEYTISLTVRNASGSDTESITLTITKPAPYVNSVRCAPASPVVGESVTCVALISRGAPESYSWSGGASSGSAATYTTSFATAGEHTVTLTATNSSGSDTNSSLPLTVTVASGN